MIIRSQDREKIVNLNNITRIDIENGRDGMNVWASNMGITSLLGTYSTEEKAIKVLDMIQQEYGRHFYGQGGQMATADIYIQPFAFIPPKVFQMPQDSEV